MEDLASFDFIKDYDKRVLVGNHWVFLQRQELVLNNEKTCIYNIVVRKNKNTRASKSNAKKDILTGIKDCLFDSPSCFFLKIIGYNNKYNFLVVHINKKLKEMGLNGFIKMKDLEDENGIRQTYILYICEGTKNRLMEFFEWQIK